MNFVAIYLLVVLPMTLVVLLAVGWPRPWQVVLLLLGPAVTGLAVAGAEPFALLGWIAAFGVPYLYLLVPPMLPWRRPWARVAVPVTTLVLCAALALLMGVEVAFFYLAFPLLAALGALVVDAVNRHDRRVAARLETELTDA